MNQQNYPWKRPENVPYPSVWKRFKGRREIDGGILNFWIQDIPEEDMENAIDFMMSGFPRDEPLNQSSGLASNTKLFTFLRNLLGEVLQYKMGLICYKDNPDPNGKPIITGVHATYPKTKWDPEYQLPDETMTIISGIITVVNLVDAFKFLKTDILLCAMGLYVSSKFRRQNLGLELLMARENLCKAVGIKASVSVVTASVSQILSERAGFKVLPTMPFEILQTHDQKFIYPEVEDQKTGIKYMYKEF